VLAEEETASLDWLVPERDGALAEATRLRNQLHQLLLPREPTYRTQLPKLHTPAGLAALVDLPRQVGSGTGLVQQLRAA
jgi:hypothetical protein